MGILFVAGGLLFGCAMFALMFALPLFCHFCLTPPLEAYRLKALEDKILALPPDEQALCREFISKYDAYLKARRKQAKICGELRQARYDNGLPSDFWGTWCEAGKQVGISEYDIYIREGVDTYLQPEVEMGYMLGGKDETRKWKPEDQPRSLPRRLKAEPQDAAKPAPRRF